MGASVAATAAAAEVEDALVGCIATGGGGGGVINGLLFEVL